MTAILLILIVSGVVIGAVGLKGFSQRGVAWNAQKQITGWPAKSIGCICLLAGFSLSIGHSG